MGWVVNATPRPLYPRHIIKVNTTQIFQLVLFLVRRLALGLLATYWSRDGLCGADVRFSAPRYGHNLVYGGTVCTFG